MYQDYDSDSDVPEELKQDYVDEQTGDVPLKRLVPSQIVLHCYEDTQLRVWHVCISRCPSFPFLAISKL